MWLRNPLPYFAQFPEADILATSDATAPTHDDGGLEGPQVIGRHDLNIGASTSFMPLAVTYHFTMLGCHAFASNGQLPAVLRSQYIVLELHVVPYFICQQWVLCA